MSIQYKQANIHWNYYLAIENDFEKISRYIEFAEANNNTFSIELARIIMSSTQEVDGIMKKLCSLILPESNCQSINEYKTVIKDHLPEFVNEEVHIHKFGMNSKPWENWKDDDDDNNPIWWKANNKIKHDRTQHFEKANLKNAFNAVGALLITTLYFYKLEISRHNNVQLVNWPDVTIMLKPMSSLFILKDDYYYENVVSGMNEW